MSVTQRMIEEGGAGLILLALLKRNGAATVDGQEVERAYRDLQRAGDEEGSLVNVRALSGPHIAQDPVTGGLFPTPAVYEVSAMNPREDAG